MNRHETLLPLIEHHLDRARRGVPYNALRNCHAVGIHSVVLHDEPGNRIRMFFADYAHTLHQNRDDAFSLGIHAHHCAIRLVGLFGGARNDVYALTPHPEGAFAEQAYTSGVGGESSLTPTGRRAFVHRLSSQELSPPVVMKAHEMHTIYLARNRRSAWLVIEGEEDASYESLCWTNAGPFNPAGLYEPMEASDVAEILTKVCEEMQRPSA